MNESLDIKIFSLNVNGLGDKVKRQAIFNKLKRKGNGIFLLQETHSSNNFEKYWKDQWGGNKIYFSHGSSNSKGVCIIFSENIECNITKEIKDNEGRYIILDVVIKDKIYTLANLYAPTSNMKHDQLRVFGEFQFALKSFTLENTIIGGDFNIHLNPRLDKLDSMSNTYDNQEYRDQINSLLETENLLDIWRTLYPYKRTFTWSRGKAKSRLDYFFTSDHLLNIAHTVDILPGFHSDHSLIYISFMSETKENIGKGFWKFNSSLLEDKCYVDNIKAIIKEAIQTYSHIEDKRISWELIKMKIRDYTVPYCIQKKQNSLKFENDLNKRFMELYNQLQTNDYNENIQQEYNSTKFELEQIEKQKARGILIRSKCRWAEEGEKSTSYFLRLEKHNFCNKLISQLQINDKVITDPKQILEEEKQYYEKLYTDNIDECVFEENCEIFTKNKNIPKITNSDRDYCESKLLESEILSSLKALKNGKSPGSDGLTAEFYKFFWQDIKTSLIDSIYYSIENGELSVEQKRGIITLIPKKDKNRLFLKNWRPISLLNVDYKILAKCLAHRLSKVLPYIINEDQTGYIKGRFIGCNIRQIEDLLIYSELQNTPGIILTIDFEKAFDSISWKFIDRALESFNFGPKFRTIVSVLYKNISTSIINNGDISDWFMPKRGVRQGCPVSPYLFIIAVELLAIGIRENPNIKGIKVNGSILKISQLADDTTCFVADIESIVEILNMFKRFEYCAGLKVNRDKTKANFIGSLKGRTDAPLNLDWTDNNIKCLGVTLNGNENDHYHLNYKQKILNLKNLLNTWKGRALTLKGKITVINNLALPPLLYIASVIHTPESVIKEVKELIVDFIWDGKRPKIAYDVLIQEIGDGGLKLMDMESKVKSLKAIWVKRFFDKRTFRWKEAAKYFYGTQDLEIFFRENHSPRNYIPKFYQDVHNNWAEVTVIDSMGISPPVILGQIIWNNRYITIRKQPYCWQRWRNAGILTIGNIMTKNNTFMDHIQISQKYSINCNFLEVLQLRQSLPSEWKNALCNSVSTKGEIENKLFIGNEMYNINSLTTRNIYVILIKKKYRDPTCMTKWYETYPGLSNTHDKLWSNIFKQPFAICRETSLQTFQYKLIHRLIFCQKKLFQMNLADSAICQYCKEIDDIRHFFLFCSKANAFWNSFFNWWNSLGDIKIAHDCESLEECVLFGFQIEGDIFNVMNYCILIAKNYIHCQKIHNDNNIDFFHFLVILKSKLTIERNICNCNNNNNNFEKFMFLYEQL